MKGTFTMQRVHVVAYLRHGTIYIHGVYNRASDATLAYEAALLILDSTNHTTSTEPLVSLYVDAPNDSGYQDDLKTPEFPNGEFPPQGNIGPLY